MMSNEQSSAEMLVLDFGYASEERGAPCGDSPRRSDKNDEDPSSEEPEGAGVG